VVNAFDLIVACDVFCYFGDLLAVFSAARQSLQLNAQSSSSNQGYFGFSTEASQDENQGYTLHECARFAHSESYLRRLATEQGMQVVKLRKDNLRKNQGKGVLGILAIMTLK
jgi:predicted TPR repeat methyltransferase